jgi:hypothetical protein
LSSVFKNVCFPHRNLLCPRGTSIWSS